jgi:hypothetical protein
LERRPVYRRQSRIFSLIPHPGPFGIPVEEDDDEVDEEDDAIEAVENEEEEEIDAKPVKVKRNSVHNKKPTSRTR